MMNSRIIPHCRRHRAHTQANRRLHPNPHIIFSFFRRKEGRKFKIFGLFHRSGLLNQHHRGAVCVSFVVSDHFVSVRVRGVQGPHRLYGSISWIFLQNVFIATSFSVCGYTQVATVWWCVFSCRGKYKLYGFLNSLRSFHTIQYV